MARQFLDWMRHIPKGWVALFGLVVFMAFTALVLPRQSAQTEREVGMAGSPDMSFVYTADDLYRMAEAYGQAGRDAYIRIRFTFDVVWPLVYTLFLSTAISWVYAQAFAPSSGWRRANLVPVLGALFDYLENLSTSLVMWRYPAHTIIVDRLAPVFTLVKWVFVGTSFVLLFVGMLIGTWQWARKGRRKGARDGDR